MALHQILPVFTQFNPLARSAVDLQFLARRFGHFGRIYSDRVDVGMPPMVEGLSALDPRPEDVVFYHSSLASPASEAFLAATGKRGVVFHRSPMIHYSGDRAKALLAATAKEQERLAGCADFAIILSERDRGPAEAAGFKNIHLVPRFIEPERYAAAGGRPKWVASVRKQRPNFVANCELVPHERIERLYAIHREVLKLRPGARLFVITSSKANQPYAKALAEQARGIAGVRVVAPASRRDFLALLRLGDVCLSTSLMPDEYRLLEAMAADLPLMIIGGADYSEIAQNAVRLAEDEGLRRKQLAVQAQELKRSSSDVADEALGQVLASQAPRRKAVRRSGRPRIAAVVQRYGDVIGGSEKLAGEVVRQLSAHWEITVLTTCAKSYLTWANEFPAGEDVDPLDPDVKVHRFPVSRERTEEEFGKSCRQVFGNLNERLSEELWAFAQGPYAPGLFEHIDRHGHEYDGFLFFTYLYAHSALGVPMVADRALLVPTAHDEPAITVGLFNDALARPRRLLLLTPEELDIIMRYHPKHAPARAVGTGVDMPDQFDPENFRQKFEIERDYLIYVGRLTTAKGVGELIAFHRELRKRDPNAPDLVLAGEQLMPIEGEGVHYVGRIDERDKWNALAGAFAVTVPSRYESLSLLAVEGLGAGAPILVNAGSEVLQGHVDRSRGGMSYTDLDSFVSGLSAIADDRDGMSERGRAYAAGYTWPNVVKVYREEMEQILRR